MKKLLFIFIAIFSLSFQSKAQLELGSCEDLSFDVGQNCSQDITLQNSASYVSDICEGMIEWVIIVDLWEDGTADMEYKSSLPLDDQEIDDTDGNGIPDLYISPTDAGSFQVVELLNVEGTLSEHSVSWKAIDACGNDVECAQFFEVIDDMPPIADCISVSSYYFQPFIESEVYAQDFMLQPSDNCTAKEELRFSFSGDSLVATRIIDCYDVINSPIDLKLYVWDNYGNVDFCTTQLHIFEDSEIGDCFKSGEVVEGFVITEDGEPIANAEVTLTCLLPEFPKLAITDSDGYYSLGIAPDNFSCTISVEKHGNYLENVTALDLVKIMRHLLGIESFTTPYQYVAADVNGTNNITASDLFMHRSLILGVISEFPNNSSWKFFDSEFVFENISFPWVDLGGILNNNPYQIEIDALSKAPFNFIGVKVGNIVD